MRRRTYVAPKMCIGPLDYAQGRLFGTADNAGLRITMQSEACGLRSEARGLLLPSPHRLSVRGDVLVMLFESAGEAMMPLRVRDEVVVIRL